MITALLITAGALWLSKRTKSTNGIGAAKRRIYKEISLAQKAGVDFSKKYEDLTEDEILALERVSSNTGYTETYYKGLKKAYDAISGIGSAYNVTDENGNTVLTWIEDPAYDEIERQQAMMEARAIDDERYWAMEHQAQEIEEKRKRALELEAKAAESRKRLKKMRQQPQQQSLFGIGGDQTYTKQKLNTYLGTYEPAELVAEYVTKNKVLCSVGDNYGGRSFYLSRNNFLYLFNYCLMRHVPIAVWSGDHWILRNDGEQLISGCGVGALRTEELLEPELMDYLRTYLDSDEVSSAMYYIDQRREPLYVVNPDLSDQIRDMVEDWCTTNAIDPDGVWSVVDEDDILFAL